MVETIQNLSARNATFSRICLFKDWTYFAGTGVGKVLNHHGILIEVSNASGIPEQFLQLEYGARGTYWQMGAMPFPDPRYGVTAVDKVGSIHCRYTCGKVAPSHQDPQRLLWFMDKYQFKPYNIFYFNCIIYAKMVYRFHLPFDEQCLSTAEMQQQMGAVAQVHSVDNSVAFPLVVGIKNEDRPH